MSADEYEADLRRLIELRFQAEITGRPSPEVERLEAKIYAVIGRRPNPVAYPS